MRVVVADFAPLARPDAAAAQRREIRSVLGALLVQEHNQVH